MRLSRHDSLFCRSGAVAARTLAPVIMEARLG
jgi:hypothetical protein